MPDECGVAAEPCWPSSLSAKKIAVTTMVVIDHMPRALWGEGPPWLVRGGLARRLLCRPRRGKVLLSQSTRVHSRSLSASTSSRLASWSSDLSYSRTRSSFIPCVPAFEILLCLLQLLDEVEIDGARPLEQEFRSFKRSRCFLRCCSRVHPGRGSINLVMGWSLEAVW